MDREYKQKFSFAKIRTYKNYSNLSEKTLIEDTVFDGGDVFSVEEKVENNYKYAVSLKMVDNKINSVRDVNLFEKGKGQFFHTNNPNTIGNIQPSGKLIKYERIRLVSPRLSPPYEPEVFITDKYTQIKRHYNNPFSEIIIEHNERSVKQKGNKITIRCFKQIKARKVNSKYFSKTQNSITLVFDMDKGNFLIVKYDKLKKRKPYKIFRCNTFSWLENSLTELDKIKSAPLTHTFDDVKITDKEVKYLYDKKRVGLHFSEEMDDPEIL